MATSVVGLVAGGLLALVAVASAATSVVGLAAGGLLALVAVASAAGSRRSSAGAGLGQEEEVSGLRRRTLEEELEAVSASRAGEGSVPPQNQTVVASASRRRENRHSSGVLPVP